MGNLGITQVTAAQNQKEVTINAADDRLDLALTDFILVDLTSGDATVADADGQTNILVRTTGNSVARILTVPQLKRLFMVQNGGSAALTVKRSTTEISLPAGANALFYTDGTSTGLFASGDSVVTFLELTDTPSAYTGHASKFAKVNSGETAIEFVAQSDSGTVYDFRTAAKAGQPLSDEVLGAVLVARAITIPADFAGSFMIITANPAASFVLDIQDDGASIGTLTISTGGSPTWATTSGTAKNVAAGSQMKFVAPNTPDTTIDGLQVVIAVRIQ